MKRVLDPPALNYFIDRRTGTFSFSFSFAEDDNPELSIIKLKFVVRLTYDNRNERLRVHFARSSMLIDMPPLAFSDFRTAWEQMEVNDYQD